MHLPLVEICGLMNPKCHGTFRIWVNRAARSVSCLDRTLRRVQIYSMSKARLMNGFWRMWAVFVLSLMLASAPAMAGHMDGAVVMENLQLVQEQIGHEAGHDAGHMDQDQTGDCQDACCSGTCILATLSGDDAQSSDLPRMSHEGTHSAGYVSTSTIGLLRPPRI